MKKRALYEKTWDQKLAEWQREQEAKRVWRKRQYELRRLRLRGELKYTRIAEWNISD